MGYLADYFLKGKKNAWQVKQGPFILYNALTLDTIPIDSAPEDNYLLMITIQPSGTHVNCGSVDHPGHVIINDEDLVFKGEDKRANTLTLSGLPEITTSGLDCGIELLCITTSGSPMVTDVLEPIEILVKHKTRRIEKSPGIFTATNYDVYTEAKLGMNDVIRFRDPFRNNELHDIVVKDAQDGLDPTQHYEEAFRILNCF